MRPVKTIKTPDGIRKETIVLNHYETSMLYFILREIDYCAWNYDRFTNEEVSLANRIATLLQHSDELTMTIESNELPF